MSFQEYLKSKATGAVTSVKRWFNFQYLKSEARSAVTSVKKSSKIQRFFVLNISTMVLGAFLPHPFDDICVLGSLISLCISTSILMVFNDYLKWKEENDVY